MSTLTNSLALSAAWDLTLDASGNIGQVLASSATAQDVATAVATRAGECWLALDYGIAYSAQVLDQGVNIPLFSALYEAQARTVPTVKSAFATFKTLGSDRILGGTVFVIDTDNTKSSVSF